MRMHRGPRLVARERTLAFYLDNFAGGGVQKNTLILAGALAARGHAVELLVCRPRGALHDQLPPEVEVTALDPPPSVWSARMLALRSDPGHFGAILGGIALAPQPSPTLGYLGPLAAALETRRPFALYTATTHMNLEALLARRLAGVDTRVVVTERNAFRGGHLQRGWPALFCRVWSGAPTAGPTRSSRCPTAWPTIWPLGAACRAHGSSRSIIR